MTKPSVITWLKNERDELLAKSKLLASQARVLSEAIEVLGDQCNALSQLPLFDQVVAAVCDRMLLHPDNVLETAGNGRVRQTPTAAAARAAVIAIMRRSTAMSYPEIARALCLNSHSTVIAAERRADGEVVEAVISQLGLTRNP